MFHRSVHSVRAALQSCLEAIQAVACYPAYSAAAIVWQIEGFSSERHFRHDVIGFDTSTPGCNERYKALNLAVSY